MNWQPMALIEFEQTPNPDALRVQTGRVFTHGPALGFDRTSEDGIPALFKPRECLASGDPDMMTWQLRSAPPLTLGYALYDNAKVILADLRRAG